MESDEIRTARIRDFIMKSLVRKVTNDLKNSTISSEGDLQSVVYYHLRRFLRRYSSMRISNKLPIGGTGREKIFPDIVISRMKNKIRPKIAIELKEKRSFRERIIGKDIKKVEELVSKKFVKYGCVIYFCRERRVESQLQAKAESLVPPKFRKNIFPIVINAYDRIRAGDFDSWNKAFELSSRYSKRD